MKRYKTYPVLFLFILILLITRFISPVFADDATSDTMPETSSTTSIPSLYVASYAAPTIAVQFPILNEEKKLIQTALKPKDQFSLRMVSIDPHVSNVVADFNELGLGTEPLTSDGAGTFHSRDHWLPGSVSDGNKHFNVSFTDAVGSHTVNQTVVVDSLAPTGTLEAALSPNPDNSGLWTTTISGSFDGTGSFGAIIGESSYELDANGTRTDDGSLPESDIARALSSPFTDVPVPMRAPSLSATRIGYSLTIADEAGNITNIDSPMMPVIRSTKPLIDHAIAGTATATSTYVAGGIPDGTAIPYAFLSPLAAGTYYAVVFFAARNGCPSDNYEINAFRPGIDWGYDQTTNPYHAYSTKGGGCMQPFYITPYKAVPGWFWGALDNNGTSTPLIDDAGIQAFAICDSASVCDAVVPRDEATSTDDAASSTQKVSSVMFLPGIKGSELFEENSLCNDIGSTCDTTVWLPQNDLFVSKLYLNSNGTSANPDIYTKEGAILTHAYGQDFYTSFFNDMDDAEKASAYGAGWSWKPIAYDWRLSLPDIVNNGVQRGDRIYYEQASGTPYIEQNLEELAAHSPTGKVTIIAHSNGGLVAKELMQKLGAARSAALIDKVILIGVPQDGAPRTIGSLLFGEWEGIPGISLLPDVIMTAARAREFGLNSPMAYHLLPSAPYVENVYDPNHPLISFGEGDLLEKMRIAYGSAITTIQGLYDFLLGKKDGRDIPSYSDLDDPNILNASLIHYAQELHSALDSWSPPAAVHVYEIGGWGEDTISGIELYQQQKKFLGIARGEKLSYRPEFTEDGDGTVTLPSSMMMNANPDVTSLWMNLQSINASPHANDYDHTNLFEIPQIRTLIGNILHGSDELPDGISHSQPMSSHPDKKLRFFLHSPASLTVTNKNGSSSEVTEDGVVQRSIPGSTAGQFGEVKYVTVSAGTPYTLSLHGEDSGTFSLDIEEADETGVIATTTFADVPVSTTTTASLTITNGIADVSALSVDEDGNGTTDMSLMPRIGETVFPPDEAKTTVVSTSTDPTASTTTSDSTSTMPTVQEQTSSSTLPSYTQAHTQSAVRTAVATTSNVVIGQVLGTSTQTTSVVTTRMQATDRKQHQEWHKSGREYKAAISTQGTPVNFKALPDKNQVSLLRKIIAALRRLLRRIYAFL